MRWMGQASHLRRASRVGDPMVGGVGAGMGLIARFGAVGGACILLAQCGQAPSNSSRLDPKYGVSSSPRLVALGEPVPKGGGTYRIGKPYTIGGRTYEPQENSRYIAEVLASWYGEDFHGRATANGEVYDMASISAAHPTLPIPSYARVTNLSNQKSIIVRVNDRGPYHANRLIDVSVRTARLLDFYDRGVTRVRVDYVGRAALEGSDDTRLAATLRSGTPAPGPSEVRIASARPFLPQSAEPIRGAVPVPPDRPFELGHEETATRVARRQPASEVAAVTRQPIAPVAAQPKTAEAAAPKSAARSAAKPPMPTAPADEWERGFAARFAPANNLPTAPTGPAPVSAFAGPAQAGGAVMSGRGLY
jgi:rare lipoprotein A